MTDDRGDITQLLRKLTGGDQQAERELLPVVYTELHRDWHVTKAWLHGELKTARRS